jgi:hypothetical protein
MKEEDKQMINLIGDKFTKKHAFVEINFEPCSGSNCASF